MSGEFVNGTPHGEVTALFWQTVPIVTGQGEYNRPGRRRRGPQESRIEMTKGNTINEWKNKNVFSYTIFRSKIYIYI
jgi:hypothetical protein